MGLEECVKVILKEDKENTNQPVPFSCSQCGTDFTTAWKWDESSKDDEVKVKLLVQNSPLDGTFLYFS